MRGGFAVQRRALPRQSVRSVQICKTPSPGLPSGKWYDGVAIIVIKDRQDHLGLRTNTRELGLVLLSITWKLIGAWCTVCIILWRRCHRSGIISHTVNFLDSYTVELLGWPACSSDMNPIENVWFIPDLEFMPAPSVQNSWKVEEVNRGWVDANQSRATWNLERSIPRHLYEVLANQGGSIN